MGKPTCSSCEELRKQVVELNETNKKQLYAITALKLVEAELKRLTDTKRGEGK